MDCLGSMPIAMMPPFSLFENSAIGRFLTVPCRGAKRESRLAATSGLHCWDLIWKSRDQRGDFLARFQFRRWMLRFGSPPHAGIS